MQRRRQIGMAAGLALALHVIAAVTTIGCARFLARNATAVGDATPVTLEWMSVATPAVAGRPDAPDSPAVPVPAQAAAPPRVMEQPQAVALPPKVASAIAAPPSLPATPRPAPPPTAPLPDHPDKAHLSDMPEISARPVERSGQGLAAEPAKAPAGGGSPVAASEQRAPIAGSLPSASSAADPRSVSAGGPYPVALAEILPRYPRSARMHGQEGRVVVWALIDDTGHAERLDVHESSGKSELDKAALDAVRRARFRPATRDGLPVAGEIRLPFEFRLQ